MSHSVQVTLIADQYITLIGHEVNVHDLTVIHLDDSGVVCGYSTDEHTKLRSPAPAATVTGWRLLEVGEVVLEGDEWWSDLDAQWFKDTTDVGELCDKNTPIRRRLTPPAQGDEMRDAAQVDLGDGDMPSIGAIKELVKIARKVADHENEYPDEMEEDEDEFILCPDEEDKHRITLGMLRRLSAALALVSPKRRSAVAAVREGSGRYVPVG